MCVYLLYIVCTYIDTHTHTHTRMLQTYIRVRLLQCFQSAHQLVIELAVFSFLDFVTLCCWHPIVDVTPHLCQEAVEAEAVEAEAENATAAQ